MTIGSRDEYDVARFTDENRARVRMAPYADCTRDNPWAMGDPDDPACRCRAGYWMEYDGPSAGQRTAGWVIQDADECPTHRSDDGNPVNPVNTIPGDVGARDSF